MKSLLTALCLLVLAPLTSCAQNLSELADDVRSAEMAFAETMAQRDLDAFLTYVADDAVFVGRDVLRGIDAVKDGWSRYFEDPEAPFSWEPAIVEVLESGSLALSSGPVRNAEGERIGTYNSIWRRDGEGRWKVVFDNGCPPCDCEKQD